MSESIFSVTVNINTQRIKTDITAVTAKAQPYLDAIILRDSNFYCPLYTGELQKSSISKTRIGSGELVWRRPYARRLYYEYVRPPYARNPNACRKWVEAAAARWHTSWEKQINDIVKRL